jgi:RimJ/RimL family protein N-acetyltransferase
MIIYRLDLTKPPEVKPQNNNSRCEVVTGFPSALRNFPLWVKNWGWSTALKTFIKILSGRRIVYFSVLDNTQLVQSGWANLGFCRFYPVEWDAVVLGTLYTSPEFRGKGFSTSAKSYVISYLYERGYRRFYADTTAANIGAQKTSERLGFQRISETPDNLS